MKQKKKKALTIITVSSALLLFLALRETASDEIIDVTIRKAETGQLVETIPSSGKIRPVVEVIISPDVSGEIVGINFDEGDYVHKGEVVLQIKQDLYKSIVEQAEASLGTLKAQCRRCEAELALAENTYRRDRELFRQEAISEEEYEKSEASRRVAEESLTAARYNVRSGEASLKEANENLVKTTILSPIDGIISMMNVEEGERVVGTSQMAGTEMFRVADFSRMEVVVDVSENDVVHVERGNRAEIEVDAYPRVIFEGFVTQVANSAQNIGSLFDQVTNFEVRIEIATEGRTLLPGMSASASIVTREGGPGVTVPVSAVFTHDRREYVWTVTDDMTVEEREVTTGIQDLASIEVTSGLKVGERVVTAPMSAVTKELANGRKVRESSER